MTEVKNDTRIGDIFSRGRHKNTSVILLLQNLFPQGKAKSNPSKCRPECHCEIRYIVFHVSICRILTVAPNDPLRRDGYGIF
jgi:hypothetical protein